jgi:hypothetical protein
MAPPRLTTPFAADDEDPNRNQPTPGDLHRYLHRYFELASFFTMVAGLLNILVIYDAFAGPVASHHVAKKVEREPDSNP